MGRCLWFMGLLAWLPSLAFAQLGQTGAMARPSWEESYEQWLDMTDEENTLSERDYEYLQGLSLNKLDLNTATREDLEQLPFLSAQQIMELQEYVYRYGGMRSLGELKMIRSLDHYTRSLLLQFVTLSPLEQLPDTLRDKHHVSQRLLVTAKLPAYVRRGDKTSADKGGYIGPQWKHSWRYTVDVDGQWKGALVASQDAGEPFFHDKNKWGWDYYSFYLLYRPKASLPQGAADRPRRFAVRDVLVGRYRLHMGMGLVLNNNLGFGKAAMLQSMGRSTHVVSGHSSRSEANYLQGAAATVALWQSLRTSLDVTGFASWRKVDATLDDDGCIRTLLRTGYHRTRSEMDRRRNASQTALGGNLNWRWKRWHAGLTAASVVFDKALRPDTRQRYRQWNASGKRFWNASVDYGYTDHRLNVSGETATGDGHGWATVNSVGWEVSSSLRLMALQRFYAYRYHALLAHSFSEGGTVQNESGGYVGAEWDALKGLQVSAYADYAYFAWARYRASQSSHAWDNLLSVTYTVGPWTWQARYRLKRREYDNADKSALCWKTTQRGRLSVRYDGGWWNVHTQLNAAVASGEKTSRGWMLTQQGGLAWRWLDAYVSVSCFHTDDYDSRLYIYERGPLYTFSNPMMYGEGMRYAVLLRANLGKHFYLLGKLSTTDYFDRSHISSGMQRIDHSSQTDVEVQLSVKL